MVPPNFQYKVTVVLKGVVDTKWQSFVHYLARRRVRPATTLETVRAWPYWSADFVSAVKRMIEVR